MTTKGTIVLGDLHLVSQTWRSRPEIQGDAYRSLKAAVAYCLQKRLSLCLAGDTFDSASPDAEDVLIFRTQIDLLEEAGLPVYAIQGNHDGGHVTWFGAVHSHIQHVHGKVFEPCEGLKVMGFDYMPASALEQQLGQVPADVKCLMLHQAARPVLSMPGAWNFDPEWVPHWVNRLLMGDIHIPTSFTWGKESLGNKGWYTGSAHMMKLDEPVQKCMLEVSVDENGDAQAQHIALPSRSYVTSRVTSDEEVSAVCEIIRSVGETDEVPPVVVVSHTGVPGLLGAIDTALADRRATMTDEQQPACCVWVTADGNRAQVTDATQEVVEDQSIETVLAGLTVDAKMHEFVLQLLADHLEPVKVIAELRKDMYPANDTKEPAHA